jgi:hypothetical protein
VEGVATVVVFIESKKTKGHPWAPMGVAIAYIMQLEKNDLVKSENGISKPMAKA